MSQQDTYRLYACRLSVRCKGSAITLALGLGLAALLGCGGKNSASLSPSPGNGPSVTPTPSPSPSPAPSPSPSPAPSPSPTPPPTGSPQPGPLLFAGNGSTIWVGRADRGTGQVTVLPSVQTDGATIKLLVPDPQGRFLYTAQRADNGSSGNTGIGVFAVDAATGTLSRQATTILSNAPLQVAVERSGKWIYIAESGAVRGFSVSGSGPTELPGSPFAAATVGPLSAVTPGGRYLINVGNGQAAVFAIDPATGAPVAITGSPFSTGAAGEQSMAISPNGSFLFILTAGSRTGDVVEMTIGPDGSLALVPECYRTSPKTVACRPPLGAVGTRQGISGVPGMVVDPTSQYLYLLAADSSGATRVVSLGILNGGGLTPVPGSPFAQNIAPNSMAVDSAGRFLLLGTQGTVFTYTMAPGAILPLSSTTGFSASSNLVTGP